MTVSSSKVVLVTGSSSGIGLALVRSLVKTDYRVVITARERSLARIPRDFFAPKERFLFLPLDVTSDEERRNVFSEIEKHWGGVDILVNNAGISYRAVIEHMEEDDEVNQLETNYHGPIALARLALPWMRKNRFGKIINVSSVGGMMAMPTMGAYSAAKFALEGASEALWYELKPWNVSVTLIQPGFINSNSFRNVYYTKRSRYSAEHEDDYHEYYKFMGAFIAKLMNRAWATPETIAERIVSIMDDPNPPLRVPATLDAHFFAMIRRFLPRRLYHWILFRNLPGISTWGKL